MVANSQTENKMALAAFLVKFDMKVGNSLIWSKAQPGVNIDLTGIEFMAMPSGLHSKERDVIRFVMNSAVKKSSHSAGRSEDHSLGEHFFGNLENSIEGIAVFKQNLGDANNSSNTTMDRSKVQMYSLGVLCVKGNSEISSKCWGFVDVISELLDSFMSTDSDTVLIHSSEYDSKKFSIFNNLLDYQDDHYGILGSRHPSFDPSIHHLNLASNHPILSVTELLNTYGPLIFELWKSALLRDRILLIDTSGSISVESMCKFVYILSVFGTIPNDVFQLIPLHKQQSQTAGTNPVYNITVSDISSLHNLKHYIATTTDEIMNEKRHLYDLAVLTINKSGQSIAKRSCIDVPGLKGPDGTLSPGFQDKRRFQILMSTLGLNSSDQTDSYSIFSHIWDNFSSLFSLSALYGLLWWATAGEQAHLDTDRFFDRLPVLMPSPVDTEEALSGHRIPRESESSYFAATADDSTSVVPLSEPWQISVIGYFQERTRRIFQTVASLVEVQDLEQADTPLQTVITIEPPDLMDMGLDPISSRDHEFVVEFINIWWGRLARVNHICC